MTEDEHEHELTRLRTLCAKLGREELRLFDESRAAYGTNRYEALIEQFYAAGRKFRAVERELAIAQHALGEAAR